MCIMSKNFGYQKVYVLIADSSITFTSFIGKAIDVTWISMAFTYEGCIFQFLMTDLRVCGYLPLCSYTIGSSTHWRKLNTSGFAQVATVATAAMSIGRLRLTVTWTAPSS